MVHSKVSSGEASVPCRLLFLMLLGSVCNAENGSGSSRGSLLEGKRVPGPAPTLAFELIDQFEPSRVRNSLVTESEYARYVPVFLKPKLSFRYIALNRVSLSPYRLGLAAHRTLTPERVKLVGKCSPQETLTLPAGIALDRVCTRGSEGINLRFGRGDAR